MGVLRPQLNSVNMVNAPVIARERGIEVAEVKHERASDYNSMIRLTVTTDQYTRAVTGTLFGGKHPRIVDIKGIEIEAEFAPHMLYITNDDKPGFIGRLGTLLGREQGQYRDLPSRPRQAGRLGHRAGPGRPADLARPFGQDRRRRGRGAGQGAGLLVLVEMSGDAQTPNPWDHRSRDSDACIVDGDTSYCISSRATDLCCPTAGRKKSVNDFSGKSVTKGVAQEC